LNNPNSAAKAHAIAIKRSASVSASDEEKENGNDQAVNNNDSSAARNNMTKQMSSSSRSNTDYIFGMYGYPTTYLDDSSPFGKPMSGQHNTPQVLQNYIMGGLRASQRNLNIKSSETSGTNIIATTGNNANASGYHKNICKPFASQKYTPTSKKLLDLTDDDRSSTGSSTSSEVETGDDDDNSYSLHSQDLQTIDNSTISTKETKDISSHIRNGTTRQGMTARDRRLSNMSDHLEPNDCEEAKALLSRLSLDLDSHVHSSRKLVGSNKSGFGNGSGKGSGMMMSSSRFLNINLASSETTNGGDLQCNTLPVHQTTTRKGKRIRKIKRLDIIIISLCFIGLAVFSIIWYTQSQSIPSSSTMMDVALEDENGGRGPERGHDDTYGKSTEESKQYIWGDRETSILVTLNRYVSLFGAGHNEYESRRYNKDGGSRKEIIPRNRKHITTTVAYPHYLRSSQVTSTEAREAAIAPNKILPSSPNGFFGASPQERAAYFLLYQDQNHIIDGNDVWLLPRYALLVFYFSTSKSTSLRGNGGSAYAAGSSSITNSLLTNPDKDEIKKNATTAFNTATTRKDHHDSTMEELPLQMQELLMSSASSSWHPISWDANSVSGVHTCSWGGIVCSSSVIKNEGDNNDENHRYESFNMTNISSNSMSNNSSEHMYVSEINLPNNGIIGTIPRELFWYADALISQKVGGSSSNIGSSIYSHNSNNATADSSNASDNDKHRNDRETTMKNQVADITIDAAVLGHGLSKLNLQSNQLQYYLPSYWGEGALSRSLQHLDLSDNLIEGYFPQDDHNNNDHKKDFFKQLPNLRHLNLGNNRLKGTIPATLGLLMSSSNQDEMSGAGSGGYLEVLLLNNNLLRGGIPTELGGLYGSSSSSNWEGVLVELDNESAWEGEEKQWDGAATAYEGLEEYKTFESQTSSSSIQQIDLSKNELSGNIPTELGQLYASLEYLALNGNELTGTLPGTTLSRLVGLTHLDLSHNQFSGNIPFHVNDGDYKINYDSRLLEEEIKNEEVKEEASGMLDLILNADYDLFNDDDDDADMFADVITAVPTGPSSSSSLSNLINLKELKLSSNRFTGSISSRLGQLSNLLILYLYDNQLDGMIPTELGLLTNLESLYLQGNSFIGSIPEELCSLRNDTSGVLHYLWSDCREDIIRCNCCSQCF